MVNEQMDAYSVKIAKWYDHFAKGKILKTVKATTHTRIPTYQSMRKRDRQTERERERKRKQTKLTHKMERMEKTCEK